MRKDFIIIGRVINEYLKGEDLHFKNSLVNHDRYGNLVGNVSIDLKVFNYDVVVSISSDYEMSVSDALEEAESASRRCLDSRILYTGLSAKVEFSTIFTDEQAFPVIKKIRGRAEELLEFDITPNDIFAMNDIEVFNILSDLGKAINQYLDKNYYLYRAIEKIRRYISVDSGMQNTENPNRGELENQWRIAREVLNISADDLILMSRETATPERHGNRVLMSPKRAIEFIEFSVDIITRFIIYASRKHSGLAFENNNFSSEKQIVIRDYEASE